MAGLSDASGLSQGQGLHWLDGGLGGAGLVAGAAFDPLSLAPLVLALPLPGFVYQTDDTSTPATVPGTHVLGRITNQGSLGSALTQASAGSRPPWHSTGGKYWAEPDGSNDMLRLTYVEALAQPWTRISALRRLTDDDNKQILGGAGTNVGVLYQPLPNLTLYDGSSVEPAVAVPAKDVDFVVVEVHNGASSTIAINNGAPVTGNPGNSSAGGITLGASNSDGEFASYRYYGTMTVAGVLAAASLASAILYFSALCEDPPL